MTDDQQDTIGNAGEIIERFGGIRPMATKMGVPVTTVQGWKQRNAIPGNRRDDIIRVASENRLDLGNLLIGLTAASAQHEKFITPPIHAAAAREKYETKMSANDSLSKPLFYAAVLIMVGAAIGGVFALAPKVHEMTDREKRIEELEAELAQERAKKAEIAVAAAPATNSTVETTLTQMQHKVEDLTKQAEGYSAAINDLKTGTMPQRIAKLEGHVNAMMGQANALGLSSMLQKVQSMQQSPQGMDSLSGVVNAMLGEIGGEEKAGAPAAASGDITAALQKLRETDPGVAQTLEGVAPEDMKAAAMLIGLSQLRQSLARDNDSFDTDLALLKKTAAKDDPQLQEAIDRLAPQAKLGILTPQGLSREFRGLAGDIVSASLSGEDVSLQDRVKARLNDVMVVEKNGEQISGTPTQHAITDAQKKLDKGDVQGAIATLQTLQGPAADKVQPFISKAQTTVLATQVQQALGQNTLKQLMGSVHPLPAGVGAQGGLGQLIGQIQGMMPGQGLITDPNSGFTMYVQPSLHLPGQPVH